MLEALTKKLKSAGYKLTAPRLGILRVFAQSQGRPMSAEDIFAQLEPRNECRCDLASIYRTLNLLEFTKIIRQSDVFGGVAHYELAGEHRHHIICRSCHKTEPLKLCQLKEQEKQFARLGYREISHRLEFSGLCPTCA